MDRAAFGMHGEGVGEDQRGAAFERRMMHGDRDHAAERQAAKVSAGDSERVHRRQDRGGIIVTRRALARRVAIAIARIIEGDRAAGLAEMVELRMPHRFVRADAVEEDDRSGFAAAGFEIAERSAVAQSDAGHALHLGSVGEPALALAPWRG